MAERFTQERVMHELKRRRLTVLRSVTVAPRMQRVTLSGDLEGFTAPGPADHVKLFFPDPVTGEIVLPVIVDGRPQQPAHGTPVARDYTPAGFREGDGGSELDLDFVLHGDDAHTGPASSWAANAIPGDELVIAGPRGSLLPPTEVEAAILIADETALPAAARWLDTLGEVPVTGLFTVAEAGTANYLASRETPGRRFHWFTGADRDTRLEAALRSTTISEGTFVFLAGEAGALIPLRRYLRRELGLPKAQVDAHGYWKRGQTNLDHHAPLDPSDPD